MGVILDRSATVDGEDKGRYRASLDDPRRHRETTTGSTGCIK